MVVPLKNVLFYEFMQFVITWMGHFYLLSYGNGFNPHFDTAVPNLREELHMGQFVG